MVCTCIGIDPCEFEPRTLDSYSSKKEGDGGRGVGGGGIGGCALLEPTPSHNQAVELIPPSPPPTWPILPNSRNSRKARSTRSCLIQPLLPPEPGSCGFGVKVGRAEESSKSTGETPCHPLGDTPCHLTILPAVQRIGEGV
jgi:hypothetical protein